MIFTMAVPFLEVKIGITSEYMMLAMDFLQVVFLAVRHQAKLKLKEETVKRIEGECLAI